MTTTARMVLADCEVALQELLEAEVGAMWRCRWVAALALLRAVGHVLKHEAHNDPQLREIVSRRWALLNQSKQEPAIFWEFIESERNGALKEYQIGPFAGMWCNTGARLTYKAAGGVGISTQGSNERHIHIMKDGPFKGRREADLVSEAINWWRTYLDEVDAEYTAKK